MTLRYNETKDLIERFLSWDPVNARKDLHEALAVLGSSEAEFYDGIISHGPGLKLSTEQWFELLSRLPIRLLRSQLPIEKILSEAQLKKLPPVLG